MSYKFFVFLVCIGTMLFSQDIVEIVDTIDMTAPGYEENAERTDTLKTTVPVQKSIEETDTLDASSPVQQEKINLLQTIPEPPTRPIAQTIIGAVLTGSGGLILILDFVLIGLGNAAYGEIRPQDKPSIIVYAVGGGIEVISGIALLSVAIPKWKNYNEWEAKYQNISMNSLKINITFSF